MFSAVAFPLVSISFLVLLIISFISNPSDTRKQYIPFLMVIIGLFYDATVVSLGRLMINSVLLYPLNLGRFLIHAFISPLLIPVGVSLYNTARAHQNKRKIKPIFGWIVSGVFIIVSVFTHLIPISIEVRDFDGIVYYTSSPEHRSFPIVSVLIILIYIILGIVMYLMLKQNFWFLLVGSILTCLLCALPPSTFGIAFSSIGELILCLCITITIKQQKGLMKIPPES